MGHSIRSLPVFLFVAVILATCGAGPASVPANTPQVLSEEFKTYWYQGKGELNRYDLRQARYGELRTGHALMVFVTEDFLIDEQVKHEGVGDGPHSGILKLNRIDRFNTGIYDYSLMTSTFSPVDGTPAMKVTCSVQDWCGQAFMQLNREEIGYRAEGRSYFESEGDTDEMIGTMWLEDAIWNQVRIDPGKLPIGELSMLPALSYLRLMHKPKKAVDARAELTTSADTSVYRVEYPAISRTVEIRFGTAFPHMIFGWKETRPDGFGANVRTLSSEAKLTHQLMEPYWKLHDNAHDGLRKKLGLPEMMVR